MIKFDKEQVLLVYKTLVSMTGGGYGVRDEDLMVSAIEAPFQTFGGVELFPSIREKGARLGYGLVANHPFIDGNKRIGLLVMLAFLEANGVYVNCYEEELVDLGLGVASGKYKYEDVLEFVNKF